MTEATDIKLSVSDLPYADVPVGGRLLADLGAGNTPPGFPLLGMDPPRVPEDSPFVDRAALAESLAASNAALGNTLANDTIDALRTDARLIVTGQQPGLLLGPTYTLLKAITAIGLAETLRPRCGVPLIPAFWIASEDHDIEEVNRCTIGSRQFVCDHDELNQPGARPPVGNLSLQPWRDDLLAFVDQALPTGSAKDATLDILRNLDLGSYTTAFAQLLAALVGSGRMVLIDPMRLRDQLSPALAHVVEHYPQFNDAFERGGAAVRSAGYDPPLDNLGLFRFVDGQRMACEFDADLPGAIRLNRDDYSPGAGLRPIVQDLALPTLATIGGPGELLYLWQIDPLYEVLGAARSRLWPRLTATLLDTRNAERARTFNLSGAALFKAADLADSFDASQFNVDDDDVRDAEALRDQLIERLKAIGADEKATAKAARSIAHQVGKVADRVRNERLSRHGLGKGELKQLANAVLPHGKPAERVVSPIDYVGRFGVGLIDQLQNQLDPTVIRHRVIEVDAS